MSTSSYFSDRKSVNFYVTKKNQVQIRLYSQYDYSNGKTEVIEEKFFSENLFYKKKEKTIYIKSNDQKIACAILKKKFLSKKFVSINNCYIRVENFYYDPEEDTYPEEIQIIF